MTDEQRIGERIKLLRQRKGLTQSDLAGKSGLATSHFSALERGGKNPTVRTLRQVADALDVTLAELIAGDQLEEFGELAQLVENVPARLRASVAKLLGETIRVICQAADRPGRSTRQP